MLLQEKQLSDFYPYNFEFADSLTGQSLIALLNVCQSFSTDAANLSIISQTAKKKAEIFRFLP